MHIQALAGTWHLKPDPHNCGKKEAWFKRIKPGAKSAPVPGIVQQVFPGSQGIFWYWHDLTLVHPIGKEERARLRFSAVEYLAEVWLNGIEVGRHEGAETPFVFDVTRALKSGKNLLAVRVLKPGKERIEGLALDEIPHRCQYDYAEYQCGRLFNSAGIIGRVELAILPEVRIEDIFARPDAPTGPIDLTVTVEHDPAEPYKGDLVLALSAGSGGDELKLSINSTLLSLGESKHELTLIVDQPRLWNIDDPNLYSITARVGLHAKTVRCGFRDFHVREGFFHLNGKRLFLRCSHTIGHYPVGQIVPPEPDLIRRELLAAKSAGFNCIRFIAGVALPEQLDFCDEIGLMIYEETYASWALGDSPYLEDRYHRSYNEMILRDRNHPAIVIWGLINEMAEGRAFRCAVNYLPQLRKLDSTRVVLLGSGRWDGDRKIGSISNPGRVTWEPVWGFEGPNAAESNKTLGWHPGGYLEGAGDAHVYPYLPINEKDQKLIRTMGEKSKPIFLSECGVGSQLNVIEELRRFDRLPVRDDLTDRLLLRNLEARFTRDWQRLGFQDVYPFPVDFFRASYRHHSAQRRVLFDLVRSNPQYCGYNITGLVDHVMAGEGLWTFWRRPKPGVSDALEDGWSPLRWCLFATPPYAYHGRSIELEAVLANEDILKPGTYPVTFRIWSADQGIVWQKCTDFQITKNGALALPVLKIRVPVRFPAGSYTLAADLGRGGATGDRLEFFIGDNRVLPQGKGTLRVWGLDKKATEFLKKQGYKCVPYQPGRGDGLLVIGSVAPDTKNASTWDALGSEIKSGGRALVLSLQPFRTDDESITHLPWKDVLQSRQFHNWLYHRDGVARRHPVLEGVSNAGLLDWSRWGQVIGHGRFESYLPLEEAIAAAFAVGYPCPSGYDMSVLLGRYRWSKGCLWINAFPVLDHVGRHPLADRLLLNLVAEASAK